MISHTKLKELLYYHPESGDFVWLVRTGSRIKVGDQAGTSLSGAGYRQIKIDGKNYQAHRLAWLYEHGAFPPDQIDHINGIKTDNRLENLRPATSSENRWNCPKPANNTSGVKGVVWYKPTGKWHARIMYSGVMKHLGYFHNLADAAAAYATASAKYHGEFARNEKYA